MLYLLVLMIEGIFYIISSIITLPFKIIYELFTEKNNSKKNNSKYIAPSIVYEQSYFNKGVITLRIIDFYNTSFRVSWDNFYSGTFNSLEEAKNKVDSICFEKEQGSLGEYYGFHVYKKDGMYHYVGKSTPYINVLLEYIEERRKEYERYALPEESRVLEVQDVKPNDKFPSGDFPDSGLPVDFNDLPF